MIKIKSLLVLITITYCYLLHAQESEIRQIVPINIQEIFKGVQGVNEGDIVALPASNGRVFEFSLVKMNLISEELLQSQPYFQSYQAYYLKNHVGILKGFLVKHGDRISAGFETENNTIYIEPDYSSTSENHYISEEKGSLRSWQCSPEEVVDLLPDWRIKLRASKSDRNTLSNGSIKRIYRMALMCTGEFYQANGNNDPGVTMRINASVAGINFIYNRDLAVEFNISGIVLRRNPDTDEFIPDQLGGDPRTTQAGLAITNAFPNIDSYDIGHVLHTHRSDDGWSSGGVARLAATCRNFVFEGSPIKAQGWSGDFTNVGFRWISLFAHEVGHMMGANHTFNGIGEACTDAIAEDNAYEIGSGTTIMSYQDVCSPEQNIPGNSELNNYFHVASLQEMIDYISVGATCSNSTPTLNDIPEVNANPCNASAFTIPRNTPFYLKGSAIDANHSDLTYTWEQYDEDGPGTPTQGFIGVNAANSASAPLFRSFPPSPSNFRYFPDLIELSEGIINPFNVLPNRARTIKFRLTARDNQTVGGAIGVDDLTINVSPQGPLQITQPFANQSFSNTAPMIINWNTNNTDELCEKVEIRLSLDGGQNYDYVIAKDADYNLGDFLFHIPENFPQTTRGKIMISCSDYECIKFFALNNGLFTINSPCEAEQSFLCPTTSVSGPQGDPIFNLSSMISIRGTEISRQEMSITDTSPIGMIATYNSDRTGCTQIVNNRFESIPFVVTESGNYQFEIDVNHAGGFGFVTIFRANGFNQANPCPNFISSSGRNVMGTSVAASDLLTVELEACTPYILAFYNFGSEVRRTLVKSITGPGKFIRLNQNPNSDYDLIYLVVQEETGVIFAISENNDFTILPGGRWLIYSATYKSSGITPPKISNPEDWPGKTIEELIESECISLSPVPRLLDIEGSCKLINVVLGEQTACDPADNSFIQKIVVTYQSGAGDTLRIGNQTFVLGGNSPEVIDFVGESVGGTIGVQSFIIGEENCSFNLQIQRPSNCCPFYILVQDVIAICEGEVAEINAGNDADQYLWFDAANNIIGEGNIVSLSTAGVYRVEASSSTGCKKSKTFELIMETSPTLSVPFNSLSLCTGSSNLVEITTNAATIRWFRNGLEIVGANFPFLLVNDKGLYTVRVGSSELCHLEESIEVTLLPTPIVSLGPPAVNLCEGESATLNANTQDVSFKWFVNNQEIADETGPSLVVNSSGIYRLEVTNDSGCSASAIVSVTVFSSPSVEVGPDTEFCEGTSIVISGSTDAPVFVWTRGGTPIGSNDLSLEINQPGTYVLEAFGPGGCNAKDSLVVSLLPAPIFELGEDRVECIGNTIELLGPTGDYTYEWYSGNTLLGTQQILTVNTPDFYSLVVTDNGNGCSYQDFLAVTFVPGPTLELNVSEVTICQGESIDLVAMTNAPAIVWLRNGNEIEGATDLTLSVNQAGIYTALVTGNEGCIVTRNVLVGVEQLPIFELGNDLNACEGDAITLSVGVTGTYQWFLDGTQISNNRQIQVTQSGVYRLVVTSANNCSFSDEVSVRFSIAPTIEGPNLLNFCDGESVTIAMQSDGTTFKWLIDGVLIPGQSGKELTVNTPGVYSFVASNSDGCEREKEIIVNRRPNPEIELGADLTLCPGQSVDLDAGNPDHQYLWSTGETNQIINITNGGVSSETAINYSVTVTNSFNCQSTDVVQITFRPVVVANIFASKSGVCEGESITLTASGGTDYIWSGPPGTLNTNVGSSVIASPTSNAIFSVTVSDDCIDNEDSASISLEIFPPLLNGSAGEDTCVVLGRSIRLSASGGITYEWESDPSFVSNTRVANPEVKPNTTTIYTVTITDSNGCSATSSVEVCIIEDPLSLIQVVNAITPNGDGDNDHLEFIGLEAFPDNKLTVYNRWGNVIFEKLRYQQDNQRFDGSRAGDVLPADTYYYVLEFEGNVIKSALTIIRER